MTYSNRTGVMVLLVVGLSSSRALAAPPATDAPSPTPAEPQQHERQAEARVRFARGVELYDEGDYALALIEFERAYAVSDAYRILYNIGQVQQQLGHYARALETLQRYLEAAGDHAPAGRAESVRDDIEALKRRTATLRLRVPPGAEVLLDARPLADGMSGDRVDAGNHRLRVTRAGFRPDERALTLAGGDALDLDLKLEPLESVAPPQRQGGSGGAPWAGIAWGGSGALAAGAVVFGVLAQSSASDLRSMRGSASSTAQERQNESDRARSFAIVTDVLAATAIVFAGAGLYLSLRKPLVNGRAVGVALEPGALRVQGTF